MNSPLLIGKLVLSMCDIIPIIIVQTGIVGIRLNYQSNFGVMTTSLQSTVPLSKYKYQFPIVKLFLNPHVCQNSWKCIFGNVGILYYLLSNVFQNNCSEKLYCIKSQIKYTKIWKRLLWMVKSVISLFSWFS